MRAIILAGCLAALTACTVPTLQDQRMENMDPRARARNEPGPPSRVLVLTVSGLEAADYLDPWGFSAREGASVRMPVLARLAREGVIGLAARPPSPGSTFSSHATIATGRLPARHGVIADTTLDQQTSQAIPFWDSRWLEGVALWDAAVAREVMALGWPTTAGARIALLVPALEVTGMPWLDAVRTQSSPLLVRELEAIAEQDLARSGKDEEGNARSPRSWPTPSERDAAYAELACRIASMDRDPGLWLIHFDQTAAAQQAFGSGSIELADALARVDDAIGRILGCLEDSGQLAETAVFVMGDVAYRPAHTRVLPNVPLVRAGLIGRDPRASTGVRSWLALVRSHGHSAYVYARDAQNALAARELLEAEAERTRAFDIVSANALARAGGDPQAWFGLLARPGFVIGNELAGPPLSPSPVRAAAGLMRSPGDDASSVGFVAWGRGIRSRVRLPEVELTDVAPSIATLLGLRLGDEIDGEAVLGILRAAVPPPPPGPKRLGVGTSQGVDRLIEQMRE